MGGTPPLYISPPKGRDDGQGCPDSGVQYSRTVFAGGDVAFAVDFVDNGASEMNR